MKVRPFVYTTLGVVCITASQGSNAAGFAVSAQSAYGMGNAYAGNAAVANDASTVITNPAGIFELPKPVFAASASVTAANADFTDRGSSVGVALGGGPIAGPLNEDGSAGTSHLTESFSSANLAPSLFYARQISDKWATGFGIWVPFATSSEYDPNWVGRYHAVDTSVRALELNPSVAYRINDKVSVGLGIGVQMSSISLSSKLDTGTTCFGLASDLTYSEGDCFNAGLAPNVAELDSGVDIEGEDTVVTFNIGALFKPREGTKIGVTYRHGADHSADGNAVFDLNPAYETLLTDNGLPFFDDQGSSVSASLPAVFDISVAQQINDKLQVLGTLKWTGWDSFDKLVTDYDNAATPASQPKVSELTFNWENAIMLSAGINYTVSPKLTLRAGFAYDDEPIPGPDFRSPRGPTNDRYWYSAGATYKFSEKLTANFGVTHIQMDQASIDNTLDSPRGPDGSPTLTGVYDYGINLAAFQLNWSFN